MHSYHGQTATFHFDAGLEGDVIICGKDDDGNDVLVRVDAEDILKLVAYEYVQSNLVSEIQNMSYKELLSFLSKRKNNK
jgi:hypothetical protein